MPYNVSHARRFATRRVGADFANAKAVTKQNVFWPERKREGQNRGATEGSDEAMHGVLCGVKFMRHALWKGGPKPEFPNLLRTKPIQSSDQPRYRL